MAVISGALSSRTIEDQSVPLGHGASGHHWPCSGVSAGCSTRSKAASSSISTSSTNSTHSSLSNTDGQLLASASLHRLVRICSNCLQVRTASRRASQPHMEADKSVLQKVTSANSRSNSAAESTATTASVLALGSDQTRGRGDLAHCENPFMPRRPTTKALPPQAVDFSSPSQSGIHQSESQWATQECESSLFTSGCLFRVWFRCECV